MLGVEPNRRMSPQKDATETEKGFGTGLRAQLERRREPTSKGTPPPAAEEALAAARKLVDTPPPENVNGSGSDAEVEAVRAELAASLTREQELRTTLADQLETREHELALDRELAARSVELDGKAARLPAAHAEPH